MEGTVESTPGPLAPRDRPRLLRPGALAACVVVACSCAGAPPPSLLVGEAPAVSLPLSFREGLPEVDVAVGGQHAALMLDTGAGAAVSLAPSLLQHLPGVSYTGRERHLENARGDLLTSRAFVLAELSLGALTAHGVAGQELVYTDDFAPPNRDGYVGRGLFARHRLLVDYGARQLTVLSGAPQPVERSLRGHAPTPVRIDGDGVVVTVTLDGAPARFVLDTGSTHSLLRRRGPPGRAAPHDLVVSGERLPGFALVEADAGPPGVEGMLGRSFFEGWRVLLDLPEQRMWIEAARPR